MAYFIWLICKLRVHFFGKNPNPDSESKKGFLVSLVKSKKGLWIQWIRSRRGFNGLIWIRILRIYSSLLRFFGKGFEKKKYMWQAVFVAREKSVFGFFVSFLEKNSRLISFRILCFFGKKESVWSLGAIIHFFYFAKESHPKIVCGNSICKM